MYSLRRFVFDLLPIGLLVLLFCEKVFSGEIKGFHLWSILKARAGTVESFQADIIMTERGGAGRKQMASAARAFGDWLAKSRPEMKAEKAEYKLADSLMRDLAIERKYYRYYTQKSGEIRIEDLGIPNGEKKGRDWARVLLFSGDRWQDFWPSKRLGNVEQGQMSITLKAQGHGPIIEVARGQAVISTPTHPFNRRASALSQVLWEDLLPAISPEDIVEFDEVLPGASYPLPMLQLTIPPKPNTFGSSWRLKLWFGPKVGHSFRRMECQHSVTRGSKNEYVTDLVVEWSGEVKLQNGLMFPVNCVLKYYSPTRLPVEKVKYEDWPIESFEYIIQEIQFSNVQINGLLDQSLFKFSPPEGTNVIDEVGGFRYVVGSVGEQLKKIALKQREITPPAAKPVENRFWQTILFFSGCFLLVACAVLAIVWRLNQRRFKQ